MLVELLVVTGGDVDVKIFKNANFRRVKFELLKQSQLKMML